MNQHPLWRIKSGTWAGWDIDGSIYNTNGKSIGHVTGTLIFDLNGKCIAELYDDKYVGLQEEKAYPTMANCAPWASIVLTKCTDIKGVNTPGWSDPLF